jgi:heterodisulfide reductase subunit C
MGSEMQAVRSEKSGLNFAFREKLNSVAEGFRHNYCYQCGACVADFLLKAILGFESELISAESEIWDCTNCYTCSERCPQDVRPIDVIIALKNLCVREGKAPQFVGKVYGSVLASGITTKMSSLVEKRRKEFGLAPLKKVPVEELKKMMGLV